MFSRKKRGYMTVEATLVMPFIVIGIVFIIYMGFYLYDVCVIRQLSYAAALRAGQQIDFTQKEMENYAKIQLDQLTENRLLAIHEWEEEIKVNSTTIRITVSASLTMPFSGFFSEKLKLWEIHSTVEVVRVNPKKFIQSMRGSNDC